MENIREGGKRNDEKILDEKMDGNKTNRKSVVSERIRKVKRAGAKGRKETYGTVRYCNIENDKVSII